MTSLPSAPPAVVDQLLVAADFHLAGSAESRHRLQALLEEARRRGAPLFILGDLFHYWFGRRHLELDMYREELALLRDARDSGVSMYLLPGNRDFLLDTSFSRRTGIWVGGNEIEVTLGDSRVHFSHGDLLCPSDLNYQAMRRLIRWAPMRMLAHQLPSAIVDRIAARLREHSERVVKEKSATVLEPDRAMLLGMFAQGSDVVVCGHFHKFRDESFDSEHGQGRFLILDPFEERGGFLSASVESGWTREFIAP